MAEENRSEIEPTSVPGVPEVVEASPRPAAAAVAPRLPPLWRNRDYMLLWSGQVVSTVGSGASAIVYPLLVLWLTNSYMAAGLAGALGSLPYLIFSLPVGALIDRWDRKRVMILCDIGRALTLASIPVALLLGVLTIWQIYVAVLIEGSLFVFFNIAEVAALPRVVDRRQLPEASAQNEASFGIAGIVGPSLGTFVFQLVGRAWPFVVDSVSYIVSVFSLTFIRTEFQGERTAQRHNLRTEIAEGLSWLWHHPLIRYIAFLTGGLNFVGAGSALIVINLAKGMGASDAEIGLIFSVGSVGGIVGAILGGFIQRRFRFGQVITGTVWLQTLMFPLYLVMPHPLLLGVVSALVFMTGPVYNVTQFSYRLSLIPDALQGRVNSTFRLLAFGFQPLGQAVAGALLERAGGAPTVLGYTAVMVGLALLTTVNRSVQQARPIAEVQPG